MHCMLVPYVIMLLLCSSCGRKYNRGRALYLLHIDLILGQDGE